MRIGIITGSGTYALPGFEGARAASRSTTAFGAGARHRRALRRAPTSLHVSRHGEGHPRLSSHVTHQANIAALRELGADGVLAVTVCGAVDPALALGALVVFDDLHFLANRLPDGSLCTLHTEPGRARPRALDLRRPVLRRRCARRCWRARADAGLRGARRRLLRPRRRPALQHPAEIADAARGRRHRRQPDRRAGDGARAARREIPYALLGYATDYANGVADEPTPVEELVRLIGGQHRDVRAPRWARRCRGVDAGALEPVGTHSASTDPARPRRRRRSSSCSTRSARPPTRRCTSGSAPRATPRCAAAAARARRWAGRAPRRGAPSR